MGLNRDFVGRSLPATTYSVEREAIRAYARATNEDNPRLAGPQADLASPSFAVVFLLENMVQGLFNPELIADANIGRMVHGSQDMRFLAPVRPGDRLVSTTEIQSIEDKGSGELLTLAYRSLNQDCLPVLEATSGFFFRGPPDPARVPKASQPTPIPSSLRFDTRMQVAPDQPSRYAEASGDRNPIHLDVETAKMMGFPGVVLHGLCTMALAQKALLDALAPEDPAALRRLAVQFSKVVFPEDTLRVIGWDGHSDASVTRVEFVVRNQRAEEVIRGGIAELAGR
jgi:acyl dehydratase